MRRKIKRHVPAIAPAARARSLTVQTAQKAKQAKLELLVIVPLMAVTVMAYVKREELFGADTPVRVGAALAMVALGWLLARDLGRFAAPALFRRMDPATAGTVSFLIRLVMIAAAVLLALRVGGLDPATLAVGGAITAVVIGLAPSRPWATCSRAWC
jgi:small-conductance mechanosensitive channel